MQIEGHGKETSVHVKVSPGEEQFIKLINTGGDKGQRKMQSTVRDMAIKPYVPKERDDD